MAFSKQFGRVALSRIVMYISDFAIDQWFVQRDSKSVPEVKDSHKKQRSPKAVLRFPEKTLTSGDSIELVYSDKCNEDHYNKFDTQRLRWFKQNHTDWQTMGHNSDRLSMKPMYTGMKMKHVWYPKSPIYSTDLNDVIKAGTVKFTDLVKYCGAQVNTYSGVHLFPEVVWKDFSSFKDFFEILTVSFKCQSYFVFSFADPVA